MISDIKKLIIAIALLFSIQLSYSQLAFSHEVGIIAGPVVFRSDYGERGDFESNINNLGVGIGLVYYMNFDYLTTYYYNSRNNYFTDHFKVRAEISWNKSNLQHYGKWVDPERTSLNADKLRAHSGESQNWNLGVQLEYFPLSIKGFSQQEFRLTPFLSGGIQYVSFNSSASTTFGDGNVRNPNNFYSFWEPGSINPKSGNAWSVVSSVGARYKLSVLSDLMIDLRFQGFFNDNIDGLDHQLESNKNNDWLLWLNFGYIYYFD
ncbi:MAG: glutamate dehydrogenase [Winogradskyella sp.]|uniref:THC0290_0291 family protein n=1 Tax=Winogradskyella sp. TaxID=1883156 RepID=UPI00385E9B63